MFYVLSLYQKQGDNNIKLFDTMATINLKRGDFLKRIADIENNPNQWQYLGERPALVDFYAPWCGPCRMLMPVLDELAKEYAGKVDIYKVNVEDEQQLAEEFGIRSIPTLLFIPKQGLPQTRLGAMQKSQLREVFDRMAQ